MIKKKYENTKEKAAPFRSRLLFVQSYDCGMGWPQPIQSLTPPWPLQSPTEPQVQSPSGGSVVEPSLQ